MLVGGTPTPPAVGHRPSALLHSRGYASRPYELCKGLQGEKGSEPSRERRGRGLEWRNFYFASISTHPLSSEPSSSAFSQREKGPEPSRARRPSNAITTHAINVRAGAAMGQWAVVMIRAGALGWRAPWERGQRLSFEQGFVWQCRTLDATRFQESIYGGASVSERSTGG